MSKAERRHHDERIKRRTITKMRRWVDAQWITPKAIGKNAAVHMTCDCGLCTAPVKWCKPKLKPVDDYAAEMSA